MRFALPHDAGNCNVHLEETPYYGPFILFDAGAFVKEMWRGIVTRFDVPRASEAVKKSVSRFVAAVYDRRCY
jgi:hypothetical protein